MSIVLLVQLMSTLDGGCNSPAEKLDKYRTSTSQQIHVLFITNLNNLTQRSSKNLVSSKSKMADSKKLSFFLNRQQRQESITFKPGKKYVNMAAIVNRFQYFQVPLTITTMKSRDVLLCGVICIQGNFVHQHNFVAHQKKSPNME